MTKHELEKNIAKLKPFYEKWRVGRMRKGGFFSLCVKAAFAKAYEFCAFVSTAQEASPPFFYASALRGICEDIIVLHACYRVPNAQREDMLSSLMFHDIYGNLVAQSAFFKAARRPQPLLGANEQTLTAQKALVDRLQALWRGASLPVGGNQVLPAVRRLAELQRLDALYEFLYRLTSKLVHFNPGVLLRSGWSKDLRKPAFSSRNFDAYYYDIALVYGAYLFVLFFELFHRTIRADKETLDTVNEIRKAVIGHNRWPELVTFEEMNREVPRDGSLLRLLALVTLQNTETRLTKKHRRKRHTPAPRPGGALGARGAEPPPSVMRLKSMRLRRRVRRTLDSAPHPPAPPGLASRASRPSAAWPPQRWALMVSSRLSPAGARRSRRMTAETPHARVTTMTIQVARESPTEGPPPRRAWRT